MAQAAPMPGGPPRPPAGFARPPGPPGPPMPGMQGMQGTVAPAGQPLAQPPRPNGMPMMPPNSNGAPAAAPHMPPAMPTMAGGAAKRPRLPPQPRMAPQMNQQQPLPTPQAPNGVGAPPPAQPTMAPPSRPGMMMPPSSTAAAPMPPMQRPAMTPTAASGPPMSSAPAPVSAAMAPPAIGQAPTMAGPPRPNVAFPPASGAPPMPAVSGPPRPGMPPVSAPAPGMGYTGGPPRPGMPPQPVQQQPGATPGGGFPPAQNGMPQPMGAAGPPRPGMPPQPGMPPRPGMAPGMPPQPGMAQQQPGMPPQPGMGMPPQPGMGMAPQPGMGMPPQPGMQPQPGMPPQPGMGYPPAPGAPGGPGGVQSPRRALDPDQMPSPIHVIEEDQKTRGGYFETREKGLTPPLISTKFITRDFGNASPRFIRSTMYNVPATPDMMKQTGVPFGLVLSPFAPVEEGEVEPPVSDFGASGPVRCMRCKAYMCPFMQFIDGGRRFQCVFCKATTEVPQDYFQHLDHNGQRLDHYQRPELCLGAYEVLATKDYCRDSIEPKVPGVIFAIDVSYPMMKEGIVPLICANMKRMLRELPRDANCDSDDRRMRVGFITYDSKLHFYNINEGLSQPQQMTVGDVQDMFVPLVEGLMVDVDKAETVIDALLEQIPAMFGDTRETETVLGPVIQAGKEAFKAAQCAGKLVIFHHNLPTSEAPGKLKNRDDRKVLGTDKEKTVLMPQNKFYNELGQECVSVGCSVDLFLFNNAYVDIATLSQVCRLTGGQLYKYTYFQTDVDGERFLADLAHDLSRPVAFDAIMRVRTSTGVRPVDFYGSFYMANTTDTELAAMNSDSAIACEIKHDDKLTEEDGVYIQAAILFTSVSGQRRLRILNLSLNTGTSMADMYRNCELDTLINFTAKQSISRLMETNPKTVKEHLISNCANILACYRKNCASPSSAGQLILPECMKLLPLYVNCLVKSDVLAGGADVGCDDRAYLMSAVSSMDVKSSVVFFYPKLYPIHDLNTSEIGLPDHVRCSIEKVRDDGVYLLENGIYLFMYIGLAADPGWVQEVFGVPSASQIDIDRTRLESRDTPLSQRVRNVIDCIRADRPRFMRLVLVRQREKLDVLFRRCLCEDRTGNDGGNFSYVDFLCHMHKEIRQLLG